MNLSACASEPGLVPAWHTLAGAQRTLLLRLLHWGADIPLDLRLIADLFVRAAAVATAPGLKVDDTDLGARNAPLDADVLVLAQAPPPGDRQLAALIARAPAVLLLGAAVPWFARTRWARGLRLAVPWTLAGGVEALGDAVTVSPAIIESAGKWTTCCGGAASLDLGLLLLRELLGAQAARQVQQECCIERVREPGEPQRQLLPAAVARLLPKLSEAVALMQAHLEEPLETEAVARRIGLSRRQLERLFRQHLNTLPSRYYLELRLERARRLLRQSSDSVLQVALRCGFSSGSHFSTAYSAMFGITPRDERQRLLRDEAAAAASLPPGATSDANRP